MGTVSVRPLADLRRADAAEFGAKSANLGELASAGLAVPAGFAVGVSAFRLFVETAGLGGLVAAATARAASGDLDAVSDAAKAIDEAMRFAPIPEALRAELASSYLRLAEGAGEESPPVAVRSSAVGEDSHEATYAGQQESFLWVRGGDQVCDAVRDCWVSLYTPRALSYRAARGAGPEPAMGVAVQLMVDAEVSGVLFTCNPVSGDPSMVTVNAAWGLGMGVVGGEVTPDDYLVSKVTGEVVRRTVGSKAVEYVPDEAGRGVVRQEVLAERRQSPCLSDEALAALVEVARRVERHFGCPQDVEWAISRHRPLPESLLVLQARPVTGVRAAPRAATAASALALVMTRFGAPESLIRS